MTLSRASRDAGTFPALVLTLLLLAPVARAADVAFYLVAKGLAYDQTSTAQPVPKGSPDRFTALVGMTASNSITTASVQALPSGSVIPLVFQASGSAGILDEFNLTAKYTTNTDLNAAFPNGNYKMAIQTAHDGAKSLTLALNGNSYPASVPYLGNFTAAQKINPAAGFTLTWPAFSGGTANDIIRVTIADVTGAERFSSPDPGQPGALNGTATSVVIPANTLPAGAPLAGLLVFAKVVAKDTTSYPGASGFAVYFTQTQFNLNTIAITNATPPTLSAIFTNSAGPFQIRVTGQAGSRYAVDATSDLLKGPWAALFTNTATGGTFLFIDAQFSGSPHRFYRARSAN